MVSIELCSTENKKGNSKLSEQYNQQIASYAENEYARRLNLQEVKKKS